MAKWRLDCQADVDQYTDQKRFPLLGIILTSSREEGDRAFSYDNGANSYRAKPVAFAGLLAIVQKIDDYWLLLNVPPPKQ